MGVSANAYPEPEIRAELARILASANFEATERNRRFLEHIVEEALAGRASRLKAYPIATAVFGRPDDFDPAFDPVVRMEAGRLRRALERFYLLEAPAGPIRMSIPKGGYRPEFFLSAAVVEAPRNPAPTDNAIVITPFETEDPGLPCLHFGFTRQLMVRLHQSGLAVAIDRAGYTGDRVLTGHLAYWDGVMDVSALLVEGPTGRMLWGSSFQRNFAANEIVSARDEVADLLAHAVHAFVRGQEGSLRAGSTLHNGHTIA